MIQFRTGPHMGIPYQEARALGLSSTLKGPEFYEQYVSRIKVTTPSERLLRGLEFYGEPRERMGKAYTANRPTVTLQGLREEIMAEMESVAAVQCGGEYILGLLEACAKTFETRIKWSMGVPFDVLKPARKEKPE